MADPRATKPLVDITKPGVLPALGAVAGQIAHDFNNLLTPLMAYPRLIRDDLPAGAYAIELLGVVEKAAQDMVHITRQLQGLVPREPGARKNLHDLNRLAQDVVQRARAEFANGTIETQLKLAPDLPQVPVWDDDACLALYHLCLNAGDAMESKGGILEVTTSLESLDRGAAGIVGNGVCPGTYAVIRVRDTGEGIPDAHRARVFEPSFTTRKNKKRRGSGFGLAIVYRVMCDHGGYVGMETREGAGSAFSLYFPAPEAARPMSAGAAATSAARDSAAAAGTPNSLLLVDDEKSILQLFRMILSGAIPGCHIDVACNGAEAVELFTRVHHRAIVMDLHMPVMDGHQAFLEIQRLCREKGWEMPSVVFCTGFAPPDALQGTIAGQTRHCLLSKPVTGDKLVDTVIPRLK